MEPVNIDKYGLTSLPLGPPRPEKVDWQPILLCLLGKTLKPEPEFRLFPPVPTIPDAPLLYQKPPVELTLHWSLCNKQKVITLVDIGAKYTLIQDHP